MKQLVKWILIPLMIVLSTITAKAENKEHVKTYAVEWVATIAGKVPNDEIKDIVDATFKQGVKHNIDPLLILSVMKAESRFKKNARNRNSSGLMQVIPYWHRDKIKSRNIFAINVNVEVGTKILRDCLDKYSQNVERALGCYRGANDKKYMSKIKSIRASLQKSIVENQFRNQLPIYHVQASDTNLAF